ncbi:MAG: choice-of-anchor D domain-containing protein, partial [Actinomycetes bacterium]
MRRKTIGSGIGGFLIFVTGLVLGAFWSAGSAAAIAPFPTYQVWGINHTRTVAIGPDGLVYVTAEADLGNTIAVYQIDDNPALPEASKGIHRTATTLTLPPIPDPGNPGLEITPSPYGVAFDAAGHVYVSDVITGSVWVFEPGATTPNAALTMIGLSIPQGLAVDSSNRVYVTESGTGSVQVFQPGATTPDPALEITGLGNPASIAIAPRTGLPDLVYVGTAGDSDTVTKYDAGTTTAVGSPLTGLSQVLGLAVDTNGRVYASNGGQVAIFEPGATTPSPSSALTGLIQAAGIARTSSASNAKTLVADYGANGIEEVNGDPSVKTYLPGPMATMTTSVGGLPATGFDFDPVTVGSSSPKQAFTITNTGGENLVFNAQFPVRLSYNGADNAQFAITENTCLNATPLVPGAACTFNVQFSPQGTASGISPGLGLKTVQVEVNDNAPDTPQRYAVTGTGVTPVFSPPASSAGDFGAVEMTSPASGPTRDITITNTGTAPLRFGQQAVVLGGTHANQFSIVSDGCSSTGATPRSIQIGLTCRVQVRLAPTSIGAKTATLTFTDNAIYADPRSPQTFALSGSGVTPVFSATPTTKSFGSIEVAGGTASQVFTITNPGTAPLTFGAGAVTVTGANADQFAKTADTCSGTSVASGGLANCTVTVTFDPSSVGAKTASLHFVDNAVIAALGPISPQDLALSGTGVTPGFSPSMASKNFGDVTVGASGPTTSDVITITNSGTSALVFNAGSITVGGADASRFTIPAGAGTNTCSNTTTSVPPGSTCSVTISFAPGTLGSKTASLDFVDNATVTAPTSPQHIALSGKGVTPVFSANMTTRNFGTIGVDGGAQSETFEVTNAGDAVLTFAAGSVTITGADNAQFSKTGDTCSSVPTAIAPAAKCTVTVRFDPSSRGVKNASLQFVDNADFTAPTSPQVIPLTGTAVAPVFSAAAPSAFGSVVVGATAPTRTITVTNTGDAPLIFASGAVALSGPDASHFSKTADTCSSQTIAAGGNCAVTVAFNPTTRGAKSANVVFTDNATVEGNTSPQSLALTGTGLAPIFAATVPTAFGNAQLGVDTPDRVFTVTNNGDAALTFATGSVTVTGTDAASFAITNNTCSSAPTSVAPTNSCAVTVRFTPATKGDKTASLNFAHNAPGTPNSYPLAGRGITPEF